MTVSIEQSLIACLDAMQDLATEGDPDHVYSDWSREVLDCRPLVVVAAVLPGRTLTWVMEPDQESVLSASLSHRLYENDEAGATAQLSAQGKALADVMADIDWLVKEATGAFLAEA
jgi:hypothetical protein